MNFIYSDLNISFNLEVSNINFLIIEEPYFFNKIIIDIDDTINKQEDKIKLIENLQEVNFHKNVDLIISPLDFKYTKSELKRNLINQVSSIVENSSLQNDINDLNIRILDFMDKLRFNVEYDFEFDEEIATSNLLKLFDIHLNPPKGTFLEMLIEYINNIKKILNKNIFILIDCIKFINKEELNLLRKHVYYDNLYIIFIESQNNNLIKGMHKYILDIDLCEIN